ncbi:hypothetical protein PG989_000912 [Apiospora arundinis]
MLTFSPVSLGQLSASCTPAVGAVKRPPAVEVTVLPPEIVGLAADVAAAAAATLLEDSDAVPARMSLEAPFTPSLYALLTAILPPTPPPIAAAIVTTAKTTSAMKSVRDMPYMVAFRSGSPPFSFAPLP